MRTVSKIEAKTPTVPTRKRVAAYARVSEEKGRTLHSLSAQVSFYSSFIQKHPEWGYVGVYADSGMTGTSSDRNEFQRLLADCNAGKIDIVLVKSISRFARNTVDLLETVRHLRDIGVEVRFEKERINSLSGDGELMLSILASFAQEESRSTSENVKWAIRKGFKEGRGNQFCLYGYHWDGNEYHIVPEEAEIVRLIFSNFLKGLSAEQTEKQLDSMDAPTTPSPLSPRCVPASARASVSLIRRYRTRYGRQKARWRARACASLYSWRATGAGRQVRHSAPPQCISDHGWKSKAVSARRGHPQRRFHHP